MLAAVALAAGCDEDGRVWHGPADAYDRDTAMYAAERVPSLSGEASDRLTTLAVGAVVHVGFPGGACVESLQEDVIDSACGELRGVRPGTASLVALDPRGRLLAHATLATAHPTAVFPVTHRAGGRGWTWDRPVGIPFAGHLDVVVTPLARTTALLGVLETTIEIRPARALAIDGYGRYFRFVCLRTGPVQATFRHAPSGAEAVLDVLCLEP